jgi:hypothetical protein
MTTAYQMGYIDGAAGVPAGYTSEAYVIGYDQISEEYMVGYYDGLKAAVTAKIAVTKTMSYKCPYRRGHKVSRWNRGIVT